VRHSSNSGNLAVGASHELRSCEEGKENLQARRLKRSTVLRVGSQISGALTLHEYHEGWLIQEGVARGIDKLDALGPQRVGERWRHMVRHEKGLPDNGMAGVSPKLMDNGAKRCGAESPFHLGEIANLAPTKPEVDDDVGAMINTARFLHQDPELRTERLHCLERLAKETLLGLPDPVHEYRLSMQRGQVSSVDKLHQQVAAGSRTARRVSDDALPMRYLWQAFDCKRLGHQRLHSALV
jgi:hypothetical protein